MWTWPNILFYVVFLGQILLISYYFPGKLLARMRAVLKTCPPSEYPKLYPKPVEYYRIGHSSFKLVTRLIMLLGFVILLAIMFWVDHSTFADDGYISEAWPAAYGMIQFLPLMALEFMEFSQFKSMRKANASTTRKAVLRRRRLFDYVSPMLVGSTVFLLIAALFVDFYVHDFVINWGHDTVQRAIVLIVTNGFLAAIAAWHLYGRKLDPHQATEDRAKQLSAIVKSMLYVSMALSVYFMTAAADDVFDLDFLDAILISLYFQVITLLSLGHMLRSLKLEDINFDVYKNDAAMA